MLREMVLIESTQCMDVMQSKSSVRRYSLHVCGVQVHGDDSSTHNIGRSRRCEHKRVRRCTSTSANDDGNVVHGPILVKRGYRVGTFRGGNDVSAGSAVGRLFGWHVHVSFDAISRFVIHRAAQRECGI